ncbi:flagellar export chaperone FliS [Alkalicoccobacillus porphyridii]|uniref:Flagellar protein FliS n=1 Tax=Alkalicoccobacillus porphyridii TaxID=2597270 RepID=A0A553ZZ04_9BACI|nr:flagellar protein FliS [Alkalicoccobacillus porphyridii]TSB46674.1 flagellar protein FliS [Alkalicoccobacillus porphyridii]
MPLISEETLHKKTSQELTLLLYEAALNNLESAIDEINRKKYENANFHLQKTNDILHRLGVGINYDAGVLSDQLEQLYNYLADQLIVANVQKDVDKVKHVHTILNTLFIAWIEAVKKRKDSTERTNIKQTNAYEKNALYEE